MSAVSQETGVGAETRQPSLFEKGYIMKESIISKEKYLVALFLVLIISITISLFVGRFEGPLLSVPKSILINIRLPRIILACLIGFSLSVSGCVFQNVFHNALASPDFLGASSGACFGAALAILMHIPSNLIFLVAFFFGMFTIFAVYMMSMGIKGNRTVTLLLVGMIISSIFSAGTSFIKLLADPANQLPSITYWLMGSLNNTTYRNVLTALIPILIGAIPLFFLRYRINLLSLSDEEAQSMGINTGRLRFIVIVFATLLTAASISAGGMIGWVGLIIPNMCRKVFGSNCTYLIPASAISGAAFLLISDDISRSVLASEIPIGIITAVIGAPVFLYIIISYSRKDNSHA